MIIVSAEISINKLVGTSQFCGERAPRILNIKQITHGKMLLLCVWAKLTEMNLSDKLLKNQTFASTAFDKFSAGTILSVV